jgi:nitrite reductase/ring-hydroxylating ferredoxin subunit
MGHCDECRRGLLRAGLGGAAVLFVPGCGGGPAQSGQDGGLPGDGGPGEGGACQPTCAVGTKTLEFPFSAYPQLRNVGGSALSNAPGYSDPSCRLDIVVVAQPSAGTYVAFSAGCPHQCCPVSFNATRTEFVCPCHGSTFDINGRVTGGPAPSGLHKLSVCADECGVYVSFP